MCTVPSLHVTEDLNREDIRIEGGRALSPGGHSEKTTPILAILTGILKATREEK